MLSTVPLLDRHPGLRTRDPDELLRWLSPVFSVRSLDIPEGGRAFDSVVNHCELSSIGLTYASYGAPVQARISQLDCFVQGFPVRGAGEACWNRHRTAVQTMGGVVGGPGSEGSLNYGDDFAHIVLRIPSAALTRKLFALIGRPVDPPLQLTGQPSYNPRHYASQVRLLDYLIRELDRTESTLPAAVVEEIEQAVIVAYLTANQHNYSHWLEGTPRAAAPWQVRRAVDYIEANWDRAITIEALVEETQTTARSLFYLFRRTYGISPMTYVSRVRLRYAREMLSNPTAETSVTSVGFICGFSNMGYFARKYHEAFGERPSETLKRRR
ncbi:AraC family transcriptional regulator [Pseudochelatococcus sp. B33]